MNDIYIAMPVYRGTDVIEETLRSIMEQTHTDFRLVMSVDGADDPTIEVCRKYEGDPRIDVVVQETRLGWPGNFNWLAANCDREFFCYWQQDDLASIGYLDSLLRTLLARPDAAIAYTDVQWFGGRFDRNSSPSIEGDPLARVMQHVEAIRYEPLRGLIRSSWLPHGDAIPDTDDESCQEEFVFLAHMAAAGAFLRVDSAMYFKRLHGTNAFARWLEYPDWRRRRGWISMGSGMYRVARGLAAPGLRPRVLGQILDRLAIERHGRAHFYLPVPTSEEIHRFVRDFVAYANVSDEDLRADEPEPLERPIATPILGALQSLARVAEQRASHVRRLSATGSLVIDPGQGGDESILGFGWSNPEPWGRWSDGPEATLRIPAPDDRAWRASIDARVHAPLGPVIVGFGVDGAPLEYIETDAASALHIQIESTQLSRNVIRFEFPQARAPAEDGLSGDHRRLGIGLTSVRLDLI